jgi:hypothetical protein
MHLTHTLTLHILLIFLAKYREFKYVPLIKLERTPLEHGSIREKSFYYQQVFNHMSSLILFQLLYYIYIFLNHMDGMTLQINQVID